MAHIHSVYDTDPHFSIDPITRAITNLSTTKTRIMQFDHNSERFTFEIPRLIDGHDMSLCNRIEIHYQNTNAATKEVSADVYIVEDMQLSPESEDVVIFSWLIEGTATMYAGPLNFHISFKCLTGTTIDYIWGTDIFKGITVGDGYNNGEAVVKKYTDIFGNMVNEAFGGKIAEQDEELSTHTDKLAEHGEKIAAVEETITEHGEKIDGLDGRLTDMGESLKATDDKAVGAHNKAVEVNTIANNALNISNVALQSNRDEVQRATEAEGVLRDRLNSVEGLAKGANQAVSFGNYQTMITAFNTLPRDAYNIGQNVMIVTLKVPDLWVSEKSGTSTIYNYTSDDEFKAELDANGSVQIGYYILSALETQKVDITGYPTTEELDEKLKPYVKDTDYATSDKAGVVKVSHGNPISPIYRDNDGNLRLGNGNDCIDQRTLYQAIRNQDLDYAIKVGLTTNVLLLTDEEKSKATEWLGTIKKEKTLDSRPIIYGTDESGKQVIFVLDVGQSANSMVRRDAYGCVYTASAKFGKHSVNLDDLNAKTKGGVGEWIEATKSGDNYDITFTEDGVYEYFYYLNSTQIEAQSTYSNTIVLDRSSLTSPITDAAIKSDDFVTLRCTLEPTSDGESHLSLSVKNYQGTPTVVFKARKLRNI